MNFADFLKAYAEADKEKETKKNPADPIYEVYEQFVDAGFSEEQAMYILVEMITAAIRGNNE